MKIRLTRNRNLASSKAKGATYGILLLLIAFVVPQLGNAQNALKDSKSSQSPAPTAVAKASTKATPAALPSAAVTDVKIAPEADKATITVTSDRPIAPQEFILDNPRRLVLDFPNARNGVKATRMPIGAASVKQMRVQQFQTEPSPIVRMVFDLEAGHGKHELVADKSLTRIVFHKGQAVAAASGSGAAPKPTGSSRPAEAAKAEAAKAAIPVNASNPALAPTTPKAAAREQKPPATAARIPAVAATAAPVRREMVPVLPEAAKFTAVSSAAQPRRTEAAAREIPAQPALIAALTPTAIPAPRAAAQASNSRFSGQPLTLDLVNVPLVDFFRLMAEEGGINIVLDPSVKGTLSMKVVKLPWDQIFEAALVNNSLDKQVDGTMVRIARKATLQEEAKQQESLKKATLLAADLETRIKRLNYAKAADLKDAVADQKTVRGTVVVDERTNSLILTDLPYSITKQIQLIESLDIPQPQVEIEARIVAATRNFARDIGIQFGFVQGNLQRVTVGGPNTFGTIGGTRPSATPTSTYAAGNPANGRGASEDQSSESAAVSTGTGTTNKGNYNVNLPATKAFGGLGISIGNIFDTFLLDAAITAGETKGWAKLISQPKVVAQNNNKAVVTQGVRFPVPVNSNNTVTVQFFDAALTLTATPQITYEGNIVLDLRVENNTVDFGNVVLDVPSIRTSESSTRVLVSDGGTTVIGGILVDEEGNSEDKVPGLGSLPVVGNLFRRTSVSRSTQEILFFVTPRIVK